MLPEVAGQEDGIVSKHLGSRYVSGRPRDWLKFKNPAAPPVKREFEEDWGRRRQGARVIEKSR
jgi:hypothetical protein